MNILPLKEQVDALSYLVSRGVATHEKDYNIIKAFGEEMNLLIEYYKLKQMAGLTDVEQSSRPDEDTLVIINDQSRRLSTDDSNNWELTYEPVKNNSYQKKAPKRCKPIQIDPSMVEKTVF